MSLRCLSRSPSLVLRTLVNPRVQARRSLNLQEYESKEIMAGHGLKVQDFRVVSSRQEIDSVADSFHCPEYVVKAQVLAGGRGKGHFRNSGLKGGVKLTRDAKEVRTIAASMIHDYLITAQTPADGILVSKVMIAHALDIDKEYYAAILLDREARPATRSTGIVLVASPCGGMDIEKVAHDRPNDIHKFPLPLNEGGLSKSAAADMAKKGFGISDTLIADRTAEQLIALHQLFLKTDATMVEINPLGVTPDKQVVCFDAKLDFDENAEFRQSWIKQYKQSQETAPDFDRRIAEAHAHGLNFVPMNSGNIGCLVNGAGLAMATMDIIQLSGGAPANFLDCGGGVRAEGVEKAFSLITRDPNVKSILVNIFGGIVNCDTIATGLIAARSTLQVPLIVRLEGTNRDQAMKRLSAVDGIIPAADLADAARKAVRAAASH